MSLGFRLADGRRWVIRPYDEEAAAIVAELGRVMCLGPAHETSRPGEEGRELCVAVGDECDESGWPEADSNAAVACRLTASSDRDARIAQMIQVATTIAREALARGGLLLHAALTEYRGSGFVMAGPGTVGKSTASGRLPLPWHSLCDDTTLVVRDNNGQFWAHPWPTWSRFWANGPGGSWTVEQPVPLRAVFFLGQAPADELEPVYPTQAAALALESAVDLVREASGMTDVAAARTLFSEGVSAAKALAQAVPAYSLKLSLTGRFWEDIERVLPMTSVAPSSEGTHGQDIVTVESMVPRGSLRMVCTGSSMHPTLQEPEFLEVRPYGTARVRCGDVVCFKPPDTGRTVVHRVVAVVLPSPVSGRASDGIRTRGDNSSRDDPGVLQAGDIIGRVTAAQHGARRRVVHGGWRGLAALRCVRVGQAVRSNVRRLPHALYRFLVALGPFDYLLPRSLRLRLVRFDARRRVFLKLLIGRHAVGEYDERCDQWRIRWPFRLFVKEQTLPDPKPQIQIPKSQ